MVAPNPKPRPLFPLGQVVATPGALAALKAASQNAAHFLHRHQHGDYGTIDPEDCNSNTAAIAGGERILSAFLLNTGDKIWVITEADRSSTCILLPDEY